MTLGRTLNPNGGGKGDQTTVSIFGGRRGSLADARGRRVVPLFFCFFLFFAKEFRVAYPPYKVYV
jgi:hypothetical protein